MKLELKLSNVEIDVERADRTVNGVVYHVWIIYRKPYDHYTWRVVNSQTKVEAHGQRRTKRAAKTEATKYINRQAKGGE